MNLHHLVGISGSVREGSFNTIILNSLAKRLTGTATMDIISMGDLPHYSEDIDVGEGPASVAAFRSAITRADGVIIATPEYNHGIPGSLKNAPRLGVATLWRERRLPERTCSPSLRPPVQSAARGRNAQLNETLASIAARVVLRPQSVVAGVNKKIVDGDFVDEAVMTFLLAGGRRRCCAMSDHRASPTARQPKKRDAIRIVPPPHQRQWSALPSSDGDGAHNRLTNGGPSAGNQQVAFRNRSVTQSVRIALAIRSARIKDGEVHGARRSLPG